MGKNKILFCLLLLLLPGVRGHCIANFIHASGCYNPLDCYANKVEKAFRQGDCSPVCSGTSARCRYEAWTWMAYIEEHSVPIADSTRNCYDLFITQSRFSWVANDDGSLAAPSPQLNHHGENFIISWCFYPWQEPHAGMASAKRIFFHIKSPPSYNQKKDVSIKIHYKLFGLGNCNWETEWDDFCYMPEPISANRIASNGIFLQHYPATVQLIFETLYTPDTLVTASCAAGTWMTCKNSRECTYKMPLQQDDWNTTEDGIIFQVPGQIPVGSCYRCVSGFDKVHYDFSGNIPCPYAYSLSSMSAYSTCKSTPSSILHVNKLWCPGGTFPPMVCPVGQRATEDFTSCICEDGSYATDGGCITCPLGHYCINNQKYICADGTYQSLLGQASCMSCEYDGKPVHVCPAGTKTQPAKCKSSYGMIFVIHPQCIECSLCNNSIISKYDNSISYLECYI